MLAFVACRNEVPQPSVIRHHFGNYSVETTENSATITAESPYITVDGNKLDREVTLTLHFEGKTIEGTNNVFTLEGLEPATDYSAYFAMDAAEYGTAQSSAFTFRTQEHTPVCTISCESEVAAKGLMATITFKNLAYLVDGESVATKSIKLEYARTSAEEWTAVDVAGESVTIPVEGGAYLEENRNYHYRVTITPEDSKYEALMTDNKQFKTAYAEITADIAKPTLKINGKSLNINVASAKVYYDGIERNTGCTYSIYYRKAGDESWKDSYEVELTEAGLSLNIELATFEAGARYEFVGAVTAGAQQKVCISEVASIVIPKDEPTPEPPTPPTGGQADTSEIAGIWHLTEWRGTTPSFDVYMSISEDGVVTLLQRITTHNWELFYSLVEYNGTTISGEYTDGVAWSAAYNVSIEGDQMTWVNTADASDISVYTRSEWPVTQSRAALECSGERFL